MITSNIWFSLMIPSCERFPLLTCQTYFYSTHWYQWIWLYQFISSSVFPTQDENHIKAQGSLLQRSLGQKDGCHCFVYKFCTNNRCEEWDITLPNLPTTWSDECITGILQLGHAPSSFLHSTNLASTLIQWWMLLVLPIYITIALPPSSEPLQLTISTTKSSSQVTSKRRSQLKV